MKTAARWIGAIVGLAVLVMLFAIAIGTGLPIYHVASCSEALAQPPDALYAVVEDDRSSTSWRSDVEQVRSERMLDGKTRWIETYENGQTLAYLERPHRGTWVDSSRWLERDIDDPTLPFGGDWKYRFDASGSGSKVTIRETGWVYNPIFRLIEEFFTGYTSTIKTYLTDLGAKYGETPAISCAVTTYPAGLPK